MERRGPAICNVSNIRVGEDGMIKTSNDAQDLRRRICVKAKAELLRRFWSIRSYAQKRRASAGNDGLGRAESRPSRIGPISLGMKQMGERSAGNPHAAIDVAGAGNVVRSECFGRDWRASPRPYRRGGSWKRGVAEMCRPSRRASSRPYATWRGLETWYGRNASAATGAPVLDPTDERSVETAPG